MRNEPEKGTKDPAGQAEREMVDAYLIKATFSIAFSAGSLKDPAAMW
jgi:hypothetical protein